MGRVPLFHTDLGPADAPALLLVHGWGGDGREWSPHAEALADRFRVVVPDLRGHGRSPVPDHGNTPGEMAEDLAALADSLGTGPVVAVGHSMGGQVVKLLAVRRPAHVRSVVALDPAHGAHGTEVDGIPARLAAYREHGARAAAEFVAGAFGAGAPRGLRTAHVRTTLGTPRPRHRPALRRHVHRRGRGRGPPAQRGVPPPAHPTGAHRMDVRGSGTLGTRHPPCSRLPRRAWPDSGHYLHEEHIDRTIRLIAQWSGATAP